MEMTELLVQRDKFTETSIFSKPIPSPASGEVVFKIDKFALTANNISYALTGDSIGYWKFFPAELPWGSVPVWGFADAVASSCADIPTGERLYGFFPLASHVVLRPGKIGPSSLDDISAHRQSLPAIYNQYRRTASEPANVAALEDERALYFPLFATSFMLYDYMAQNAWFGTEQVVIVSASSKTAFGVANMIARHNCPRPRVVGLTSAGNIGFVTALGIYDEVASYDDIARLDASKATALIDMAGSGKLTVRLHRHFGENVKVSSLVGATHWEEPRGGQANAATGENPLPSARDLPGAKPAFFFAPVHFAKRAAEWGMGEVMRRAFAECMRVAAETKPHMTMVRARGAMAVQHEFLRTAKGEVPPNEGLILSF